jgi:adenosylcobinamide-GDP ribazoletransferase
VSRLARQGELLICAIQFLTRLPTPRLARFEPDWITRAARYFPLAGQLVGLISAGVWLAARDIWPALPAAVLAIAAGVLATGGFHEDGLADTADGLGGGQTRERRLEIMKDSRLGAFGALALGLSLFLKIALLAGMAPWAGALALVVAHGGARAAAVLVMAALPYAGDEAAAKIKPVPQGVKVWEAALAALLGGWPILFLGLPQAMLGIILAGAAAGAMAWLARRLIGGVTGDVLGAVEQLAEIALLMAAAAAWAPA